jgi:hypothetical protein
VLCFNDLLVFAQLPKEVLSVEGNKFSVRYVRFDNSVYVGEFVDEYPH